MTTPLDASIRNPHNFPTHNLTQATLGTAPNPLLALPIEILSKITDYVNTGITHQEAAAHALQWGKVAIYPHLLTHEPSVEQVINNVKQMELDKLTVILWERLIKSGGLHDSPRQLTTAKKIRDWMEDPNNATMREKFTGVALAESRLKSIPIEIKHLPKLRTLLLNKNQISRVDSTIFASCKDLTMVSLADNRITTIYRDTFANCLSLQRVDLDHNQISQIYFETFANCPNLLIANLDHNQISQIHPQTFANCPKLQTVNLGHNRITQIHPQTFAGCQALKGVNLSHNLITQIDPQTFVGCSGLQRLYLYNGALLCMLEVEDINFVTAFSAFSNYVCRSPWAIFYKALSEGKVPMSDVAERLTGLEERNLIYEMVYWEAKAAAEQAGTVFDTNGDHQWGEHHVYDDPVLFCRALKRAVREQFNRLSAEQQHTVHGNIYRRVKEDTGHSVVGTLKQTAFDWGESNREVNVLRFIDAMEGV